MCSITFAPFKWLLGAAISFIIIPLYKVYFPVRRRFLAFWKPAKSGLMALITNRYAVHTVVAAIAFGVGVLNLQTNEVRAETFGEKTLLYALVSDDQVQVIEEYAGEYSSLALNSVSYRSGGALSALSKGVDDLGSFETGTVSLIGGSIITAPSVSDSVESVAPRQDIETYLVQSGDSLSSIANQFGISLNTLLWSNGLSVNSVLQPGDSMSILPTSGVLHTVASGDTLSRIAAKYDVSQEEIIAYNSLGNANTLSIGDQVIVPGGSVAAVAPTSRSTAVSQILTSPSSGSSANSGTAISPAAGSAYMIWPTDLHVITQYYGWRHTGIDVDCHWDNNNYASMDGIVQFVGWKGGYGYTVEINHGNGLVTRYGHHASMYVSNGQHVSQGQAIGLCGTTGRSTGTHLHFEVISGGRFKNPLEYIR